MFSEKLKVYLREEWRIFRYLTKCYLIGILPGVPLALIIQSEYGDELACKFIVGYSLVSATLLMWYHNWKLDWWNQ